MKIEVNEQKPKNFKAYWDNQYEVFSHFEFACGIPSALFAITTFKKNGKPNVCLHAWSTFQGDGNAFYAIMTGIYKDSHTFENINRTQEFCINFLSKDYYDGLINTIKNNNDEDDEFYAGGFTIEKATAVTSPRIKESFLCIECRLEKIIFLSAAAQTAMVIGKVRNIALEEEYAKGLDKKYGTDGFMYNVHAPINIKTGKGNTSAISTLNIERLL